jgi:O-antigen/teichoic acid export membrane protein
VRAVNAINAGIVPGIPLRDFLSENTPLHLPIDMGPLPVASTRKRLSVRGIGRVLARFRRGQRDSEPVPEENSLSPEENSSGPLRQLAIRGGAYLVGREAIGMVIRLAGLIITLRLIGPASYGIFTGAAAFSAVVTTIAQMGGEVYLIKMSKIPTRSDYDQVFTFILVVSVFVTGVALGATVVFGNLLRPDGVLPPLRVLLLCIPINVLWAPAQARIERGFGYRKMGLLELGGDLMLYGTAVPLAFLGAGAWSLVAGYIAWQSWLLVGSYVLSGLRPRLYWSKGTARELTKFGFSFSMATWISLLGGLVNPLVVGRFFGASGVGYVGFAQRLVGTIGFAQRGASRLGLVAMSRVPDHQKDRLRRAVEVGSELQLIALGVPFAIFGVLAPKAIPLLFGHEWDAAIHLYSLLALAALFGASGIFQSTLLLSRGRNYSVAIGVGIQSAVLAVASIFLVKHFGIDGFGYASLLALVGLIYMDYRVRSIVSISYRKYLLVAATIAPMVAFSLIPVPVSLVLFVPFVVFMVVPATRREGMQQVAVIRTAVSRQSPEEESE